MENFFLPDSDASELDRLMNGTSSMIIRGSQEKPVLYRNLKKGDNLCLTRDNQYGETEALGFVSNILISGRLSREESFEIIIRNQDKLQLPDDQFYRWAGNPYLVLIEIDNVRTVSLNLTEADQHLPFLIPKPETK